MDNNAQQAILPPHAPDTPEPGTPTDSPRAKPPKRRLWLLIAAFVAVVILTAGLTYFLTKKPSQPATKTAASDQTADQAKPSTTGTPAAATTATTLDTKKNYGNKYANGLLPVGDNKYTTSGAKKGYVYMCNANFVPAGQAGAQTRGPWFTNNNIQWDINKKVAIQGSVNWTPNISVRQENGKRVVTTNDLPNHKTGVFPVASNDPARVYDANPNKISSQSLTYSLAANPQVLGTPQCMGGEAGVMLTGVALFNGFDAGGRDAGAWEVQDACDGHPQSAGEYHYHTLSRCITDVSVNTVIGYALDGFPITGPKVGDNNFLTTDDLDECHGITSTITLDSKQVTSYHYVMTQDFPYSVSCFRATPIQPPGQHEQTGGQAPGGTGQRPPRP